MTSKIKSTVIPHKVKYFLALVFLLPLLIVFCNFSFNKLDPLQETSNFLEAKIVDIKTINQWSTRQHLGHVPKESFYNNFSTYKIVKTRSRNGNEYSFTKPFSFFCNKNTTVKLWLYKRNITGLTKYKLNKLSCAQNVDILADF